MAHEKLPYEVVDDDDDARDRRRAMRPNKGVPVWAGVAGGLGLCAVLCCGGVATFAYTQRGAPGINDAGGFPPAPADLPATLEWEDARKRAAAVVNEMRDPLDRIAALWGQYQVSRSDRERARLGPKIRQDVRIVTGHIGTINTIIERATGAPPERVADLRAMMLEELTRLKQIQTVLEANGDW